MIDVVKFNAAIQNVHYSPERGLYKDARPSTGQDVPPNYNPNPEMKGETKMEKKELETMSIKSLTEYFNKATGSSIKKFADKETGIKRIMAIGSPSEMIWCPQKGGRNVPRKGCETRQASPDQRKNCPSTCKNLKASEKEEPAKKASRAKKAPADRKPSKISKIRDMFKQKASWTKEELSKGSGFDAKNVMTAMAILKNEGRTPEPLVTTYDREKETFTLVTK